MRRTLVLAFVAMLSGCGFMSGPMIVRLSPEEQKEVNTEWENIIARQPTINRQELLDVVMYYQMPGVGIDAAHYRAEKVVGDRLVMMEVEFDRARPMRDAFIFTLFDKEGEVIRRESYSRGDVEAVGRTLRTTKMRSAATEPGTEPSTEPAETVDELLARKRLEARMVAVQAATQPLPQAVPEDK